MGRSKPMKRRGRRRSANTRKLGPTIKSLPDDLVTEILARVASSSLTDLLNAKLSCKVFHRVAENNHVLRHVRLPFIWHKSSEASSFFRRCEDNGNPEALYKRGMIEYFSLTRVKHGLDFLKKAANLGYVEASYVLGIILLCDSSDQSRRQGLEVLNTIKSSNSRCNVVQECREKSKVTMRQMWINNYLYREGELMLCTNPCDSNEIIRKRLKERGGWEIDSDEGEEGFLSCNACKWNREIVTFCNLLHRI